MIDVTIDENGSFRVHPESTASLRIVREPSGAIVVANLSGFPIMMNGEGVYQHGQDRFYLAAGQSHRFVVREMVGVG